MHYFLELFSSLLLACGGCNLEKVREWRISEARTIHGKNKQYLRLVDNVRCFRHAHLRHWSVGFINFPVLVVLVERRPMATRGLILVYVYSTTKANELRHKEK